MARYNDMSDVRGGQSRSGPLAGYVDVPAAVSNAGPLLG